jgi:hypothetical protein
MVYWEAREALIGAPVITPVVAFSTRPLGSAGVTVKVSSAPVTWGTLGSISAPNS